MLWARQPRLLCAETEKRRRACRFWLGHRASARDGMCKPCLTERGCQVVGRSRANVDLSPARCAVCAGQAKRSSAAASRCTMRCLTRTSVEKRGLELCRGCVSSRASCDLCYFDCLRPFMRVARALLLIAGRIRVRRATWPKQKQNWSGTAVSLPRAVFVLRATLRGRARARACTRAARCA